MTAAAGKLLSDLMALPEADRAESLELLADSLEPAATEEEEHAFDEELARRAEEIRSGRAEGVSAAEVFARLDARLDAMRR